MNPPDDAPPVEQVEPLLRATGFSSTYALTRLRGGGNNRVYRVTCGERTAVLKAYFKHPGDPRDRLGNEFGFCQFAWASGVRNVPEPLARDAENQLGLYQFIDGQAVARGGVGALEVQAAVDFFRQINARKTDVSARKLPEASEACFSLAQHVARVARRIKRLEALDRSTPSGVEAGTLADSVMLPAWGRLQQQLCAAAERAGLGMDEPIAAEDRCLSPSDFGFHNALRSAGGLVFIDFEYAGWDDPAKTVCDFFCHPGVPVPETWLPVFQPAVLEGVKDRALHARRIEMLMPLFRLEWCCIMLNEFLPTSNRRRAFAIDQDPEERRRAQVEKVRSALGRL